MADNIGATPGVGKTIAADDIGGVLYPRGKMCYGADGASTDVAPQAAGLPVNTQPLNVTDLTQGQINVNTSGDQDIIALSGSTTIRIHRFWLQVATSVALKWKSSTAGYFHPAVTIPTLGFWIFDYSDRPWFTVTAGEKLQLNLSASVQVSGIIYYTQS